MRTIKKDNVTLTHKIALRQSMLKVLSGEPIVLEAYGGRGEIFRRCYRDVVQGVVLEADPKKIEILVRQRPTWSVYQTDCVAAMKSGVGFHLPINLIDLDPYGDPWLAVKAVLTNHDKLRSRLIIAVTDGLRIALKLGGCPASMREQSIARGLKSLYPHYLDVCREMMDSFAADAGYRLDKWTGYYCGDKRGMTHYAAVLERCNDVKKIPDQ